MTKEESLAVKERKRNLASIQRVAALNPHPDPEVERLELATVLGWQLVVAKEEVKVGQVIVYCEIDSMLPGNAEWLPPAVKARVEKSKKKDWFCVKTIRLRGALSQGLIVPVLPPNAPEGGWQIGDDVTELMGIQKHEPVVFTGKFAQYQASAAKGNFPTHLMTKTDETRIQSRPNLLETLRGRPFYSTVKLDGTSATYLIDPETDEFWVCSRNQIRKRPQNLDLCPYWRVVVDAKLEKKLRDYPHFALQGEICGPGVQKNPLQLKNLDFFVFNIVDLRGGKRPLPFDEFFSVSKMMELETVPIEEVGDGFGYGSVDEVLECAKGKYPSGKTREGLVFRSKNQAISFKAINNDFL